MVLSFIMVEDTAFIEWGDEIRVSAGGEVEVRYSTHSDISFRIPLRVCRPVSSVLTCILGTEF